MTSSRVQAEVEYAPFSCAIKPQASGEGRQCPFSHFHCALGQENATVWVVSVLLPRSEQGGKNSVCAGLTEVQKMKEEISLFDSRLGKKHQVRLKKTQSSR